MRRGRAALALALALLTGCGQGGGTQTPAAFALPQPDRLVEVTLPESCETLDQLADAIDTAIFLSPADAQGETVWFSLGEVLREEALADPDTFVGRVLQITALGHDLAQTYNTSRLEEGLLGVQGGFQPAYALRTPQEEPYDRAISYTLCRNAMERAVGLTWEELPLCRDNRGWVRVVNSEQLFYALSHGYLPWCTPDDPAFPLLERCVAILSSIIPQGGASGMPPPTQFGGGLRFFRENSLPFGQRRAGASRPTGAADPQTVGRDALGTPLPEVSAGQKTEETPNLIGVRLKACW